MLPEEALRHIRVLIKPAKEVDDPEALHRVLREIEALVDRALRPQN